jgi:hypothetical protein
MILQKDIPMRLSQAALLLGGAVASLAVAFGGVAHAADGAAPAPPSPPVPTTPTYVCQSVMAVQPAVFGYSLCEAFGGAKKGNVYLTHGESFMLIPRTGDTIQKYKCWGGNVDLPTAVSPQRCTEVGSAVPAAQAAPPIPYGGPGGVTR